MAAEARTFAHAAEQRLVVECEPGLEEEALKVDAIRLRHVFMNLLTNASKYSPAGETIVLAASTEPADFVRFAVRDCGPGLPAELIPHVFDRFFRAPNQTRSGAGLGLAIAREIVVAHGGTIGCTSEIGRGTEFYFLLPK